MPWLRGKVISDVPVGLKHAAVIVTLYDVTYVDAPGVRVAGVKFTADTTDNREIAFAVRLDDGIQKRLDDRARLSLNVEVRPATAARLGKGHWTTTEATPVTAKHLQMQVPVNVRVHKI